MNCHCNRPHTRALLKANSLGQYCPRCFQKIQINKGPNTPPENSNPPKPDLNDTLLYHLPFHPSNNSSFSESETESENSFHLVPEMSDHGGDVGLVADARPDNVSTLIQELRQSHSLQTDLSRLLPFSGDRDNQQSISNFLDRFDHLCTKHDLGEEYKLQTLPLYLQHRAFDYYSQLPAEDKIDYGTLRDKLLTAFDRVKLPPVQAFKRLTNFKKEDSDSVQEFFEKLLQEVKHLDISDSHKLAIFVNGLPSFIKDILILKDYNTLDEAFLKARELEVLGPIRDEDRTNELLKALLKSQKVTYSLPQSISACDASTPLFPRTCLFCDREHLMDYCPHCFEVVQNLSVNPN